MKLRLFPFLIVALCLVSASVVFADPTPAPMPSPLSLPSLPPNAGPWAGTAIQIINQVLQHERDRQANNADGSVVFFRRFDMQVKNGARYRDIHLHQGTVINPRGWSLKGGDWVTVSGVGQADGSLNANIITVQNP